MYTLAKIARRVMDAATALWKVSHFDLIGKSLRIAHKCVTASHRAKQEDHADTQFLSRR